MNITIFPGLLRGTVTPPPSKSQAHRLIIAAALAGGESRIANVALSQDILATLSCMEGLGAGWNRGEDGTVTVQGTGGRSGEAGTLLRFDCGESGSTLRFLIPIALAMVGGGVFTGRGRLMKRPQQPYFDLFDRKGICYEQRDGRLTVRGQLPPGEYALPGNVSSQFFTGLLYALPLLEGERSILPTTPVESWDYIEMTLDALRWAGVKVTAPGGAGEPFRIVGPQRYAPGDRRVECDWSQAGFWYAAAGLGSQVEIEGMNPHSAQGDRCIHPWSERLARPGEAELDVSQCPDLVPPLAALAALRGGEVTRLVNAARLRIKESDRLASVTAVLSALGARVEEHPDSLTIHGLEELAGGVTVDCCNDHRIAMMAAVAATRCRRPVTLAGAECVAKSYPDFWEEYERLGGKLKREDAQ